MIALAIMGVSVRYVSELPAFLAPNV